MNPRRSFLLSVGTVALAAARPGNAQSQTRIHRVAFLGTAAGRDSPQIVAIERRFKELGYIEGKNFAFDFRTLEGRLDRLPEIVADMTRKRPDVVISGGSEEILKAFRQAMGTTPIVMLAIEFDPVERSFIASFARPGGNITGIFFRNVESAAKRLELLKDALPKVTRVAALHDFSTRDPWQAAQGVAGGLGLTLLPHELRGNVYDFEAAFGAAAAQKAGAVLLLSSGAFFPWREKMMGIALKFRLPVIANPNYAEAGALLAFGVSFPLMFARAADYADRILKGAKPSEMAVEQPTHYELIVNRKTAKALGITIPQSVLIRADRMIE